MSVDIEDAFHANALFSKEIFATDEMELFNFVLNLKKGVELYFPDKTIILAHASANLSTSVHAIHQGDTTQHIVAFDVEFIRLLNLFTDGIDCITQNKEKLPNILDELCRRMLFHASVKSGNAFAISQIPPASTLNPITRENGSIAIFVSGMMQMIGHEFGHLELLKNQASIDFVSREMPGNFASEVVSYSHHYDLKPDFLLKALPVAQQLRGKQVKLEIDNSNSYDWLSEIYCDMHGISAAIKMHLKNSFPLQDLVLVTLSMHFMQSLLNITQQLLRVKEPNAGLELDDVTAIYSMSERAYASIGLLFNLIYPNMDEQQGQQFFNILVKMAHYHQTLTQTLIRQIYFLLTAYNDKSTPVFAPKGLRKVAEEWGYINNRVSKVTFVENGHSEMTAPAREAPSK